MENEDLKTLFESYIAGKATPDDVRRLLRYFHIKEEGNYLKHLIILEMEKPEFVSSETLEINNDIYDRVQQALNGKIDGEALIKPMWRKLWYRSAVAAISILAIGAGILFWKHNNELLSVSVPNGRMRQITLPDSSKVWLNSGSTIQYAATFNKNRRDISLKDGNAFFDVKHNPKKPFIVHINDIDVTVLGTSFEINAFKEEKALKITVRSGKVGIKQLDSDKPAIFLLPGESITVNNSNHFIQRAVTDTADVAPWRTEKLIFENQPLAEVMRGLERKYDVHIIIQNNQLLNEKVTMRLNNQPLDNVLSAISFSNHLIYQKVNEKTIVIK